MKRVRHFLAAALVLLGLVYFFTQHESMSLGAEPAKSQNGLPTNTHAHDLPEEDASHEVPASDKLPPSSTHAASGDVPNLTGSGDTPSTATGDEGSAGIGFDFQKDLNLELPIDTFKDLSKHAPQNYGPSGDPSYTYATFFASRNPSIEDPYYLAIHSLIYRILWSPRSRSSSHPFVVFVGEWVSPEQRQLLSGAGALVRELAPLPWDPPDPAVLDRWKDLFAKLHMWNETSFSRILFLDADALPIAPIDDMFELKEEWKCIETKMQLDDFLPGGDGVCERYIFSGVPADPYSIFDANINVGSMVFTPNARQHRRLLQNYLKFDKYDVKMAEQAFLNWQFGVNSAYPPGMLEREYGAFFPDEKGERGMKVVHEKIWAARGGFWKDEWEGTWKEMLKFYRSEEFMAARAAGGVSPGSTSQGSG
ncbi:glycosyltransferase family 8 protein [Didymella exigua CBS 183.55]|uniref:Glycosyltransferase family 8 protein n=1 Tax=Didymella exigua CBS 183.55 TaxID=1150837 RepID=A0A6A5RCG5_9PLEO|nr:glycosyltransferase family 8 protein [Didymella exigua CBS 183.55]KAF1923457.1 glycosyltransferase family 8 protein [Didymella exigua CBS 183.55]